MNDLQVFKDLEENRWGDIRVFIDDNKEVWYVAKDVAEALGYVWNGSQMVAHVPEEWRGVRSVLTPFGVQNMITLSSRGLYFFLGRSDKPLALPFQKWVYGKVVPSIMDTGTYSVLPSPPKDYIEALEAHLASEKRNRALQKELAIKDKKLLAAADDVALVKDIKSSDGSIMIGEFIKTINLYPPPGRCGKKGNLWDKNRIMGRGQIFELLRQEEILTLKNEPRQVHINTSPPRLEMVMDLRENPNGGEKLKYFVTYITGAGIPWLRRYLLDIGCETREMRAAYKAGALVLRKKPQEFGNGELPLNDTTKRYGPL